MFAFLRRTFVIVLGFLLIFLFIWFAGPYFGFGSYRPLESVTARLIALAIVVGFWVGMKVVKRLRSYRRSDQLLADVVAQPQPERNRPPAEVQKLRERFDEAVTALKEQRRSGHSLYDLPWYVIIGAPGSGKTTALLNSGLKFPIEQRVGKGALRGVGGTRNCDWWFTDEAIFLDTAGRYTTQDSDAASDSLGWSEFLSLLRKHRARRPINGVILTINAHDLLVESAAAREAHVEAARSRLDELNRELQIQLPVYLMVTKCDLVDGFAEYFEDLTAEGRGQVWGVTFPYDQTLSNEAPQAYQEEFDALMTRLNERVFDRLEEARDTRRRAKIYAFPQQMATLREALTGFVVDVFDSRQFTGQVLLRGVYFTSGTQDGTPIDRLLGSIGRTFGAVVKPSAGPGKAYFVQALLKDVMIGESGLAGINRRLEARKAAAQLGAYVAAGLVAAAGVLLLSYSYNRNRAFLQEADALVGALDKLPPAPPTVPIDRTVPRLDAVRAVVDSADRYRDSTTWAMRWGLYEGSAIGNAARDAYLRELDTVLLPRVGALFRDRIRQYGSQPEQLYPYLKGYLMLGELEHLDKEHLETLAEQEWSGPRGTQSSAGQALSRHLKHLLDSGELRPLALDDALIAQARASLGTTWMPQMLYGELKRRHAQEDGLRLDQLVGLDLEKVFKRKSGASFSTPIPRLYSRDVFKQFTKQEQALLLKQLSDEAWVWGETLTTSLSSAGTVVRNVMVLYEKDYIRVWESVLDDLEFASARSVEQTREAYRILTSQSSPLRGILRVVGEQTALTEPPPKPAAPAPSPDKGLIERAKEGLASTLTQPTKAVQTAVGLPTTEAGRSVTAQFLWVRTLLAGEPGKSQIDGIIDKMREILAELDKLGSDVGDRDVQRFLSDEGFKTLLMSLRQQSAVLPNPLSAVALEIARAPVENVITVATGKIDQLYDQQILAACRRVIAGRYPFGRPEQPDVQIADFGTVFGYDGLFDRFFKEYLDKQVDTSGSQWIWRGGSIEPARNMLGQFQQAQALREMFFPPGSKTPEVKFAVTISDLDSGSSRVVVTLGGQMVEGSHRGPVKGAGILWPGTSPAMMNAAFDTRFFEEPVRYPGQWALFRMIDSTREGEPDAQPVRLRVQTPNNHSVRLTIEAERASSNPFASKAWRQFNCEL
jgi:type VI secretion system protein ImpL